MDKTETLMLVAVVAWLAFVVGKKQAQQTAQAQPGAAVATLEQSTWDWLTAVGKM